MFVKFVLKNHKKIWRMVRGAFWVGLVVMAGYVTLPFWAPTGWIGEMIEQSFARQAGAVVSLKRLSLDWGEGVRLTGLTLADKQPEASRIQIDRITVPLSPLKWLFTKRMGEVKLEGLAVRAHDGSEAFFSKLAREMSKGDLLPERIVADGSRVAVRLEDTETQQIDLHFRTLEANLSRQSSTGVPTQLIWAVQGSLNGAAFSTTGDVNLPDSSGQFQVLWNDLKLDIFSKDKNLLRGTTSGRIRADLQSGHCLDFKEVLIEGRHIRVKPDKNSPAWVDFKQGEITLAGRAWLLDDRWRFDGLDVQLPGLHAKAAARGDFPSVLNRLKLDVTAEVEKLEKGFPILARQLHSAKTKITGPIRCRLDWTDNNDFQRLVFDADAQRAVLLSDGQLEKPAGMACRISVGVELGRRTGRLQLAKPIRIQLGQSLLRAHVSVPQTAPIQSLAELLSQPKRWADVLLVDWRRIELEADARIARPDRLAHAIPPLRKYISGIETVDGIRGRFEWAPKALGTQLGLGLRLDRGSALRAGRWFVKQAGTDEVALSLRAELKESGREIKNLHAEIHAGKAKINLSAGQIQFDSWKRITAHTRIDVTNADALAAYVPAMVSHKDTINLKDGPTQVDLKYENQSQDKHHLTAHLTRPEARLTLDGTVTTEPSLSYDVQCTAEIHRAEELAEMIPDIRSDFSLRGQARIDLRVQGSGPPDRIEFTADLTRLAWQTPPDMGFKKAEGLPCRLDARARMTFSPDSEIQSLDMTHFRVLLGNNEVSGEAKVRFGALKDRPCYLPPGIEDLGFKVHGDLSADVQLTRLHDELARKVKEYAIDGKTTMTVSGRLTGDGLELAGQLDASELAFRVESLVVEFPDVEPRDLGPLIKTAEMPLTLDWRITGDSDLQHIQVPRFKGTVSDGALDAAARIELEATPGGWPKRWRKADLDASISAGDLNKVQDFLPCLTSEELTGQAEGKVKLHLTPKDSQLLSGGVKLTNVGFVFRGLKTSLTGSARFTPDMLAIEAMRFAAGRSGGGLTGEIRALTTHPKGHLLIDLDNLDLDELQRLFSPRPMVSRSLDDKDVPALPRRDRLIEAEPIFDFLRRCELTAAAHVARADLTDDASEQKFHLDELNLTLRFRREKLVATFDTAVNGGVVAGSIATRFDREDPEVALEFRAEQLVAADNLQPFIEAQFPGMKISGTLTHKERMRFKLFEPTDRPNYARSRGWTRMTEGLLVGPAAPGWVTAALPGLKLTEYHFDRVHSYFTKFSDGHVHNDMVFDGSSYNIYIEGDTFPDNTTRYELGADVSGRWVTPKNRHRLKQGRVPLMKYTGKIKNRRWDRQNVRFLWLPEVAWKMFAKNNILYRLWLTTQVKQ